MGMFDWVRYETVCPHCHKKATGFQSKSSDCNLDWIKPTRVDNFYTTCVCDAWISFDRPNNKKRWRRTVRVKREHVPKYDKKFSATQLKKQMIDPPGDES